LTALKNSNWNTIYTELLFRIELYAENKVLNYTRQDLNNIVASLRKIGVAKIAEELVKKYVPVEQQVYIEPEIDPEIEDQETLDDSNEIKKYYDNLSNLIDFDEFKNLCDEARDKAYNENIFDDFQSAWDGFVDDITEKYSDLRYDDIIATQVLSYIGDLYDEEEQQYQQDNLNESEINNKITDEELKEFYNEYEDKDEISLKEFIKFCKIGIESFNKYNNIKPIKLKKSDSFYDVINDIKTNDLSIKQVVFSFLVKYYNLK
jgi:hypothetical protein